MRRILRGVTPGILIEHGEAWRDQYVSARAAGDRKAIAAASRWGHTEIRARLTEDARGKCAYCEAHIGDVSYSHVEHIRPKVGFPALAHEWENLGLACQVCNTEKGNYWIDTCRLLDPYTEEVDGCFIPFGGVIYPRAGNVRADVTIRQIDLNRAELLRSRRERLEKVQSMLEQWATAQEPQKSMLATAIQEDVEKGEFTAASRQLCRLQEFPLG